MATQIEGTLPGIPVSPHGRFLDSYYQLTNQVKWLRELQRKYGDVFYTQSLLMPPSLWVLEPDAVASFMWDETVGNKDTGAYKMLAGTLGKTIITVQDDAEWLARRKPLQAAYVPNGGKSLEVYKQIMLEETKALCDEWDMQISVNGGSTVIDPVVDLKAMSLRIILRIMFGENAPQEVQSLPDNIKAIINFLMVRIFLGEDGAWQLAGKRLTKSNELAQVGINKMIRIARAGGSNRGYMIDVLINMYDNGLINLEQLYAEIKTVVIAGFETTANTMPYVLSKLAQNPGIVSVARTTAPDLINVQSIEDWEYVKWITNEGLRTISAAPMIDRRLLVDIRAGGFIIPAGTVVETHAHLMSTDSRLYERPLIFNPNRWKSTKFIQAGQLTFGGRRRCLGEAIARSEIATLIACMISRFNIMPYKQGQEPKVKASLTMQLSTKGNLHKLILTRR